MFNKDALYVPRRVKVDHPVFTNDQLKAFEERLTKIKEIITGDGDISVLDIVEHVDPFYAETIEH